MNDEFYLALRHEDVHLASVLGGTFSFHEEFNKKNGL